MEKHTRKESVEALQVISSTISRCEKAQEKFDEGTSQFSLLRNRVKAMNIAKSLLTNTQDTFTKDELTNALLPVTSMISKCEKAQEKISQGTSNYTRLQNIIDAMFVSKSLINEELGHLK